MISANDISDKWLISNVYKELTQLNIKKNKQLDLKMGRRYQQTFFQGICTGNLQSHEKILNISNYQGNANKNHNEISPHT